MQLNFLIFFGLGILEGITEFLPISSSTHLQIASYFLLSNHHLAYPLQLGAGLALVWYYRHSFYLWIKGVLQWDRAILQTIMHMALALIPALCASQLFNPISAFWVMGLMLILGGIALIASDRLYAKIPQVLTWKKALWIGLIQALSIVPGVSRSGACIVAVDFSFIIGTPVLILAPSLDLYAMSSILTPQAYYEIFLGIFTAFCVSLWCMRFILEWMYCHSFVGLGIYRIALGFILLILFY
jgi:undecaprenyl-diphosphatase